MNTQVSIIGDLADELHSGKKVYIGIIDYDIEQDCLNISWKDPDGEAIFSKFYVQAVGTSATRQQDNPPDKP